jgi:hypothetical protein
VGKEKAQDWQALARAVTDRRVELGHRTLRSFAEASGLSTKTLGEIEGAKRASYDRATLSQVERSLQWPAAAITKILAEGASAVPGTGAAAGFLQWSGTSFAAPQVSAAIAAATQRSQPRDDDLDPLEAKLERLQFLDHGLNPTDRRRLRDNVQLLLEWVDARQGVPEMTGEEQATSAPDLAEVVRDANEAQLREPAMREKPAGRRRVPQDRS